MTITVAIRNAYVSSALHRTKTCINCQLSRINYRSTHKICCGSPQQNPNSNQTTQHMCLGRTHQLNVFFFTKDENTVPPFIPRSKKINNYTFVFLSYLYHCGPFLVFFTAETVMLLSWGFWQSCIFPKALFLNCVKFCLAGFRNSAASLHISHRPRTHDCHKYLRVAECSCRGNPT